MKQTLSLTTLGGLAEGDTVNLELALRADDRLGGHVVQGHVDGTAELVSATEEGFARRLRFRLPDDLLPYVVERGSIAIEGVSLTVADVAPDGGDWFEVSLIPETLERTTLGGLEAGRPGQHRMRRPRPLRGAHAAYRVTIHKGSDRMTKEHVTPDTPTSQPTRPFSTIEEAIEDLRRGRMIVVCDGEDRENEGDLVLPAQFATPEAVNFMAKEGRGLICLALTPERCDELGLDLMAAKNESPLETAFTVTIEAAEGVTTGISAHDRARTIQVAIDPHAKPDDLRQPGHVFPLKAKEGGVLERTGHTEASIDFARLAGLIPAGVICEIMNEDGTMARVPDLVPYCERHDLKLVTVADLISYRRRTERLVERIVSTKLPTAFGEFNAVGYRSLVDDKHHVAMVKGDVSGAEDVLVRVHSECLTGDVFHSLRCDCGEQLEAALAMIEEKAAASCSTSPRRAAASAC